MAEDNNTEEQEDVIEQMEEDEEEKSPRSLLPLKLVLLLIVVVVGLAGGWLFLQQERTIEVDKDLTVQVVDDSVSSPTPTPTPTPTPEPSKPQVKILDTPTGYLNVRAEPSVIGGEVVGRVQPGQTYEYLKEENNWYYIEISEEEKGWVFGQYVEKIEPVQPTNKEEAGEEGSATLAALKVRVLQTPTGYLNVRNAPSQNGTRISRVQPVQVFEYTEKENGWYYIIFGDGEKGWVSGEYVEEL